MVVVLIVAAGAPWESGALAALGARSDVVVLKRCVDVDDLLATAAAGQADVAVVGARRPGTRRARGRPPAPARRPGGGGEPRRGRPGGRSGARGPGSARRRWSPRTTSTAWSTRSAAPRLRHLRHRPGHAGRRRRRSRHDGLVGWSSCGARPGLPAAPPWPPGLAAVLATRARTVLVDVDPYGGSVAQVLGVLDEVSGLLAATRHVGAGTLEEGFGGVQRGLDERLSVVTGLPRPDRWTEVRSGTVEAVLEVARERGPRGRRHRLQPRGGPGRRLRHAPGPQPADRRRPHRRRRGRRGRDRRPGRPLPTRPGAGRAPRDASGRCRSGWSSTGCGRRSAGPSTTSPRWSSGFARPVGLHFLPDDRESVDRALVTGRTLTESAPDSALVRALTEVADAIAPGDGCGDRPPLGQAANSSRSPPTVNAIIATSNGS